MGFRVFILVTTVFLFGHSFAEDSGPVEHPLLRRITVFPVQADNSLIKATEEAWWLVREALTENRRFLVASKNFLIQK
ncbi:MAG: hypothetical protein KDD43_16215, partial [Bdellovibrionales bacterium]|nr:hypothetical protein [Bdellovibrionales bacterium]